MNFANIKGRKNIFFNILIAIFYLFIVFLTLRGNPGNPTEVLLNTSYWKEDGPFELSPERGRFALLYSIVENHSFQFSDSLGKFADPDVAIINGRYVSLFAPLLSFVTIPGYIIGKFFGVSQVGTFAVVAIFALINLLLIRLIAVRLGANPIASTIAGLVFLFATPAFSYAVDLYQHHISTFLILLSIYILLRSRGILSLLLTFFLFASAIPLDYPNLFFMFPVVIFALGRIISFKKIKEKIYVKINLLKIFTPLIVIIPILFFLWFNQMSFGNPFQLSGTLPSAKKVNLANQPLLTNTSLQAQSSTPGQDQKKEKKEALNFFKTRNLLNGFYIHFISPDRGVIYYTPIILFGVLGAIFAFKKRVKLVTLLLSIIGTNVLLYSMWGDPWGGWAFGSRYLIPSYAILSVFIALLLTYWQKKYIFLAAFILTAFYSIAVNTLGAITTSAIPPQAEVLNLEKLSGVVQKYTYERNWDALLAGNSKSFVFQAFARHLVTSVQYYQILVFLIFTPIAGFFAYFVFFKKENQP